MKHSTLQDSITSALLHATLGSLALLALTGCASVSPAYVSTDRQDYAQVVADS